jgi:hypothetical protein
MKKIFFLLAVVASLLVAPAFSQTTSSGSTIKGKGTINYLPLFKSATTLTSSVVYQSNNGVGIGTINNNVGAFNITLQNNHGFFVHRTGADDIYTAFGIGDGGSWTFRLNKDGSLQNYFTGSSFFSGNLGVGTTSPATRFHVNGRVTLQSLPTSSVGLSSGEIYSDSGTLKIVP